MTLTVVPADPAGNRTLLVLDWVEPPFAPPWRHGCWRGESAEASRWALWHLPSEAAGAGWR